MHAKHRPVIVKHTRVIVKHTPVIDVCTAVIVKHRPVIAVGGGAIVKHTPVIGMYSPAIAGGRLLGIVVVALFLSWGWGSETVQNFV